MINQEAATNFHGDRVILKRQHDPEERFQSDWYRHYRAMFADALEPGEVPV